MASNIDFISIDETYPIAGRDNDSQGFRDNFSIIKNNFESAKGEIEDLQLNVARVDQANNFNGQNIINANLVSCSEELVELGDVAIITSSDIINWDNGSYQTIRVTNNLTIPFSKFTSSGVVKKIRLEISNDTQRTISFTIAGGGNFIKSSNVPGTITFNSSNEILIFDFWSWNGGTTVYMDLVGRFT